MRSTSPEQRMDVSSLGTALDADLRPFRRAISPRTPEPQTIPLTMQSLQTHLAPDMRAQNQGKLLYDTNWYQNELFFTTQQPGNTGTTPQTIQSSNGLGHMEWMFVTRDVLPETLNQTHEVQSQALQQKARDLGLDPKQIRRRTPIETTHDSAVRLRAADDRTLADPWRYDWSDVRAASGKFVNVGNGDSKGLNVNANDPRNWNDNLGASLSRSADKKQKTQNASFVMQI